MLSTNDIKHRSIYVINCINERNLRVSNGELLLEEKKEDSSKMKTLTKMPFQKIIAIFIIGHISITTPLIEKCRKYGVSLIVMKLSFRPLFFWCNSAEANFLLHQKQYGFPKDDISIAKHIVQNKITNQAFVLKATRKSDALTKEALLSLQSCLDTIPTVDDYDSLMGIEGYAARSYFKTYFSDFDWKQRRPRAKCDAINTTLDIGYTILFNYIECFLRLFGFDLYVGVYHRLWFKRKSLVCDLMEPFRPIIDRAARTAWNRKQFNDKDFVVQKGEYRLKYDKNGDYCQIFFNALIPFKTEVFKYIQSYYRSFMSNKSVDLYPNIFLQPQK